MSYWRRHPKKDLQEVLVAFDRAGWVIEDPPTYYTVKCPCGDHMRQIHLTPSNPDYGQRALRWLRRQPCFTKERK